MGSCAPIALPETEVVSLSPRTLLELEPVRRARRQSLPCKLQKKDAAARRPRKKQVFVCPEPSCPHHHPSHALAGRAGIRKHFRRKHGGHRQWACARCSKAYAVFADNEAHAKTCGTRTGDTCCQHCGRVFTRVYRFVEHQDTCSAGRPQAEVADGSSAPVCGVAAAAVSSPSQQQAPTASSPRRSSQSVNIATSAVAVRSPAAPVFHRFFHEGPTPPSGTLGGGPLNLELQLRPPSCYAAATRSPQVPISRPQHEVATELRLSMGEAVGQE
ncbi:protein indeterminate-domain 16-like [Lolium perenne]|uniref:protein indeterminate-domain 16-like n=1 Tax=Lolium perenne TaxID=4522 RepID=UPI0021F58BD1|nr:zinc finger protein SHOOT GRAVITROPISM 5-like [Lolium perenne]